MSNHRNIDAILVPQGAEYNAVCRGLAAAPAPPLVVPIPIGQAAVRRFLKAAWPQIERDRSPTSIVVMGLCGSLAPDYAVGDVVLYQRCIEMAIGPTKLYACDRSLTQQLQAQLPRNAVTALTSDRFIHAAQVKQSLGQTYGAAVVDMEGSAVLESLGGTGTKIAMLRVISDDCQHDMPDLAAAVNSKGGLRRLPLAIGLMRQPAAALRLIQGSLRGLQVLQTTTANLFQNYQELE